MVVFETTTVTDLDGWLPTSLPALRNFFTPPPECSTRWTVVSSVTGQIHSGYDVAVDPDVTGLPPSDDENKGQNTTGVAPDYYAHCLPFSVSSPQYSPGICTFGQTMGGIREVHFQNFQFWVGQCCDGDMTLSAFDNCEMTFTSPRVALTTFETVLTDSGLCTAPLTVSALDLSTSICFLTEGLTYLITTTLIRPQSEMSFGTAYAKPFTVYWQYSDLYTFPAEYASSLASVIRVPFVNTATISSSTTTRSPPHPSANPGDRGSSLSPGAIAGIAIGIGAVVISVIVIVLYLWRKGKQRQRLQYPDAPEMEGSSRGLKRFMGGKWRAETDGTSQPVEAGSTSVRIIPGPPVELDGTQRERDR